MTRPLRRTSALGTPAAPPLTGPYVNTSSDSLLVRMPIKADGSAGPATKVPVSPLLSFPDGLRLLAGHAVLLAKNSGRLSTVAVSDATATAPQIAGWLLGPTWLMRYQQTAWAGEGQHRHLFGQIPGPQICRTSTEQSHTRSERGQVIV